MRGGGCLSTAFLQRPDAACVQVARAPYEPAPTTRGSARCEAVATG